MQDEILSRDRHHTTSLRQEDGKLYVHTIYNNKVALAQNKAIRNAGLMHKGQLGLHDEADIRFAISIPSNMEWEMFKKKHPDIYNEIKSPDEYERIRGCKRLQFLEPEWVVQTRL